MKKTVLKRALNYAFVVPPHYLRRNRVSF
uniref:Uncharacterized protein n=1 Tax=Anguilla anguilla TaxID=7936 RepID=A0A0E9SJT4_ANGAN